MEPGKREQHYLRRLNTRGISRVIYVVLFTFLAVYFGKLHYRNWIYMEHRVREAKQTYNEKLNRLEELKKEKRRMKDPEYVAKIAREELYFMKPGEVRIEVTPDPVTEK